LSGDVSAWGLELTEQGAEDSGLLGGGWRWGVVVPVALPSGDALDHGATRPALWNASQVRGMSWLK
jgi:hypothetical protein